MMTKFNWLLTICTALSLAACTKSTSSSQIHIQLPSQSNTAAAEDSPAGSVSVTTVSPTPVPIEISGVVVQVSAPDIDNNNPRIVYKWSKKDGTTLASDVPAFDIVTGSSRLFQVAIVADTGANSTLAYYAEVKKDLASDNESITLEPTQQNDPTLGQTKLVGRYFYPEGATPTGHVIYMYQPSTGSPALPVHADEIFSGWMNLTLFDDIAFKYIVFETGRQLFPSSAGLTSGSSDFYSENFPLATARFYLPPAFKQDAGVWKPVPKSKTIAGWFMPVILSNSPSLLASRTIDYLSDGSIQNLPGLSSTENGQTPISWDTSLATPPATDAHPIAVSTNYMGGVVNSNCNSSITYSTCLQLTPNRMAVGDDGGLNFSGPYGGESSIPSGGATFLNVTGVLNSPGITVSWSYLPDAVSVITGSGVFYKINGSTASSDDYSIDDGIDCNNLVGTTSDKHGFTFVADVPSNIVTKNIGITPTSGHSYEIVVCPIMIAATSTKTSIYYTKGLKKQSWSAN